SACARSPRRRSPATNRYTRGMAPPSLASALASWRASRSTAAAEDVDAIAARELAAWQPPAHDAGFEAAWLAAAASALHRGWAARHVAAGLGPEPDAIARRTRALKHAGPDPRTAHALATLLIDAPSAWLEALAGVLAHTVDE